ncbi:PorP/SprF family type IX secretion system membrane protein [Moheibacter sediminis]|uniref:Type IX secretion system membrane protein, PorP/SprF family n=1 Tax=Moheibacter sediminis TaxID=1434700 RepID=A0A1W2C4Y1_9FLAO|nr:PorP/SprF family type IX secretion system membrane protein [Moheibacter sediminis]SMC79768.1 type IX secretion system membrane protein, PorP/SprF family [Moheibacter sediminis]
MRKILLIAIIGIVGSSNLVAQEGLPFYNHYLVSDRYLINPSYAGANPEVLSVTGSYRNQWADLPESPNTQTVSVHATVVDRLAFGLYVFNDENGLTSLRGINLSAAYHIPISSRRDMYEDEEEDKFSFGLSYNTFQQVLDLDRINVNQPNDPLLREDTYNLSYFNLGISFNYAGLFGGVSVLDIPLAQNEAVADGIEPLPTWYYLMLGYKFRVTEGINLEPSLVMNLNSNSERHLDLNLISHIGFGERQQGLDLGVSYRQDMDKNGSQGLSVSPLVKLKIGGLKLGMSYDIGLSDIATEAGNGILFSLGYDFSNPFNPDFR